MKNTSFVVIKENTVDFSRVNYYQPIRVKVKENTGGPCSDDANAGEFMISMKCRRRINSIADDGNELKRMYDIATTRLYLKYDGRNGW